MFNKNSVSIYSASIESLEEDLNRFNTINRFQFLMTVATIACVLVTLRGLSAQVKVFSEDVVPNDQRLQPPKDLNGYFPFQPPSNLDQWETRKAQLTHQVKVSLGLEPMPSRSDLNPVVHEKTVMDGYTVEKAFFESMPGFYVTGSLYRPSMDNPNRKDSMPGILCPHGHWSNGRFYDAGVAGAKAQIAAGAESDVETARNPIQARCVHLARMGCVVFQYDMIGYADSIQISYDLAHRFAKQRPDYNTSNNWGLFSTKAEQHLQSVMGLQSWNSIRAVDFLETLPDVDKKRLAVTGASGGGTQTFLLAAIEPRIQVAFPAVMVSTAMQGGCTCENCSLLRVTTGNVELAALFAPKPMGVTAANDWTKEMNTKGFPQLKTIYELYGKRDDVMLVDRTEFGHNYNKVSRTAMYKWFKKHLNLPGNVDEKPYKRLTAKELTVWTGKYNKPQPDPKFERRLLKHWAGDSLAQIAQVKNRRSYLRESFRGIFQRKMPSDHQVEFETISKTEADDHFVISGLLKNKEHGESIPVTFLHPKKWNGHVAIVSAPAGKAALFSGEKIHPQFQPYLKQGISLVGGDLLFQGEFVKSGETHNKTRRVANPREAAAYTFGYNHSLFAQRSHDLANLITLVAHHEKAPTKISLIGLGKTGALLAGADLVSSGLVDQIYMTPQALDALDVSEIHDPYFLPGSHRYGGILGMLEASGTPVTVFGATDPDLEKKRWGKGATNIQSEKLPVLDP